MAKRSKRVLAGLDFDALMKLRSEVEDDCKISELPSNNNWRALAVQLRGAQDALGQLGVRTH